MRYLQLTTLDHVAEHQREAMMAVSHKDAGLHEHLPHTFSFVRASILPSLNAHRDFGGTGRDISQLLTVHKHQGILSFEVVVVVWLSARGFCRGVGRQLEWRH
jgi:hypothetical protein